MIKSRNAKYVPNSNTGTFSHLVLSDTQYVEGCKLVIDSWADTWYSGKHSFVEEFVEGKTVTATVFTSSRGSL